jgi:hypothetical protein
MISGSPEKEGSETSKGENKRRFGYLPMLYLAFRQSIEPKGWKI